MIAGRDDDPFARAGLADADAEALVGLVEQLDIVGDRRAEPVEAGHCRCAIAHWRGRRGSPLSSAVQTISESMPGITSGRCSPVVRSLTRTSNRSEPLSSIA